MLCGLLRSEGIEAIANDTHLQTVDPLSSPALGFVSIDVRREDLERAREVLGEKLHRPPSKRVGESGEGDACPACGEPLAEESPACRECGWTDTEGEPEAAAREPARTDAPIPATDLKPRAERRPGSSGAAGWTAVVAWLLYWALAQQFLPDEGTMLPAGPQPLDLHDRWMLILGGVLAAAVAAEFLFRGSRPRVRPRSDPGRLLAQGLAAGLFFDIALDALARLGHVAVWSDISWLAYPLWAPAILLAWPLVRGAGFRETAAALGFVRGAGVLREALLGVAAFPALMAATWLCDWILGVPARLPHSAWTELSDPEFRVMSVLASVVVAPVAEEILFRGAAYRFLRDRTADLRPEIGIAISTLVSAAMFALPHFLGWGAVPAYLTYGAGFALLREWRGSLIACVTLHAAINAYLIWLFFATT